MTLVDLLMEMTDMVEIEENADTLAEMTSVDIVMNSNSLSYTNLSMTLEMAHKSEIGLWFDTKLLSPDL